MYGCVGRMLGVELDGSVDCCGKYCEGGKVEEGWLPMV